MRDLLHDEAFDGHDKVMPKYLKPDLLILDDMGMKRLPKRSSLQRLVSDETRCQDETCDCSSVSHSNKFPPARRANLLQKRSEPSARMWPTPEHPPI